MQNPITLLVPGLAFFVIAAWLSISGGRREGLVLVIGAALFGIGARQAKRTGNTNAG